MRNLIRFFSFNSFVWAALGVGALLALRLARDGFSWGEKEQEFIYSVDRARVLYWLNQQSA